MMNRPPTLSKYVEQYKKLRAWWEKARSVITEAARTSGDVDLYQLVPGDLGDEVRLRVCGALAYVRFIHDLKSGRLEYGALLVTAEGKPVKYAKIRSVDFDDMGNIGGHFHFNEEDDLSFKRVHLQTMTEAVPAIVEMYFAEAQSESTK